MSEDAARQAQPELLEERRGDSGEIVWLTLNRPKARNALTFPMYERIGEVCLEVNADPSVRAVVCTGAGGLACAAGTDISQFRAFDKEEDALAYEERMDRVLGALERVRVPTIAAIAGVCTGGGAGIAAACDLRICTPSLKFGFPIARTLGNTLSMANFARLTILIGAARVKELIFMARLGGADVAAWRRLVKEGAPTQGAPDACATAIRAPVSAHRTLTRGAAQEALRRIRVQMTPPDGGADLLLKAYMSEDFREGIEAFFAKRPARWKGR